MRTHARLGASTVLAIATLLVVGAVAIGGFFWYHWHGNEAAEAASQEGRIGPEAAPRVLPGERVDPSEPVEGPLGDGREASDARP